MSRYIDADALKKAYIELRNFKQDPQTGDWISLKAMPLTTVIRILNEAPSIDIVRCKECKKANTEDCSHSYWDDDWGEWRVGYRGDDWFCADGERSE